MAACDIDLNRALCGLGVGRWGRAFGLRAIHNLDGEKAWRLSNLLFKYRSIRRKLGITQPFMDQIGVHGIPPRDLRDRYPRRAGLPADRHLLLIRPEPLLLTRHICTQDVHYQRGTLINTLYDASVKAGRTLTVQVCVTEEHIKTFYRRFPTTTMIERGFGLHRNAIVASLRARKVLPFAANGQEFGTLWLCEEGAGLF
nr:hypothetical protein [Pseudorhodobacter aquimaris]